MADTRGSGKGRRWGRVGGCVDGRVCVRRRLARSRHRSPALLPFGGDEPGADRDVARLGAVLARLQLTPTARLGRPDGATPRGSQSAPSTYGCRRAIAGEPLPRTSAQTWFRAAECLVASGAELAFGPMRAAVAPSRELGVSDRPRALSRRASGSVRSARPLPGCDASADRARCPR
jgi:hypothetical protein